MKHARKCPKCECRKIWVVNPAQIGRQEIANASVPFGLAVSMPGKGRFAPASRWEVGAFHAWICSQCGYTELYAPTSTTNACLSTLATMSGSGVSLVDSTTPAFR